MEVDVHQAKTQLLSLILKAEAGEEVIIAKSGKALVKLVPVRRAARLYKPGALKGRLQVPGGFLEPGSADGAVEALFYKSTLISGKVPSAPKRRTKNARQ